MRVLTTLLAFLWFGIGTVGISASAFLALDVALGGAGLVTICGTEFGVGSTFLFASVSILGANLLLRSTDRARSSR